MRISLHIVVALLLIALIYREILKGIPPPVCGNPLPGAHCQLHGSFQPLLVRFLNLNVCFLVFKATLDAEE